MNDDPNRLVSVAGCGSATEADMLKLALEEHGIDSVVDGSELNATLGYIGSAIGDVRILVRAESEKQAKAVIVATREAYVAPRQDPWFCGKCLEEVEGGFEICWSCGLLREEVGAPFPETATAVQNLEQHDVDTDRLGRETDNPYESPRAIGVADQEEVEKDPQVIELESKMILGLIIACGTMFIPVIPSALAGAVFYSAFRKRLPRSKLAVATFWIAVVVMIGANAFWYWYWGLFSKA